MYVAKCIVLLCLNSGCRRSFHCSCLLNYNSHGLWTMSLLRMAFRSLEPNPSEWNVTFVARNQHLIPRKFALNATFWNAGPIGSSSLESTLLCSDRKHGICCSRWFIPQTVCPHVSIMDPSLRGSGINRRPLCGISITHCRQTRFFLIKKLLILPSPQAAGALPLYSARKNSERHRVLLCWFAEHSLPAYSPGKRVAQEERLMSAEIKSAL